MRFISSRAAPGPHPVPLFQTILTARPEPGPIDHRLRIYTCLAERFLGGGGRPPEPLTILGIGQDRPATFDFSALHGPPDTPEALGRALAEQIAESITPALQRSGADKDAALQGAHQIVAQLGHREFATVEQRAVEGATGNRMSAEPTSATHITLTPHGEVLVHKSTHWPGYVNHTGQTIGATPDGPPILSIEHVSAFSFECVGRDHQEVRDLACGARSLFSSADGTRQFALRAQVQRCLLETPDAELKAQLTGRAATLLDMLLYGLAKLYGCVGIFMAPPTALEDALWKNSRHQSPRDVAPLAPAERPRAAGYRVQAFHSGTQEGCAALALGAYCQSMASRLVTHSYTKALVEAGQVQGERKEKILADSAEYGAVIDGARKTAAQMESRTERCLYVLKNALKTSSGDCLELALLTSVIIHEKAQRILSAHGFPNADVRTEIYKANQNGDHAFCVMTVRINHFRYRIAVDPWVQVCMPYDQYVDYVRSLPENDYLRKNTTFCLADKQSKITNSPDFRAEASAVLQYYLLRWRKPQ